VRPLLSILLDIALVLTFLQAPFQHFHKDEENNHHPHPFLHVHFAHYHSPASKPEVTAFDPDDDAVYQSWFALVSHDLIVPISLLATVCDFSAVETEEPYIDRPISGGHDPPPRARTAPRAPPL
jgi:hypothetical protein